MTIRHATTSKDDSLGGGCFCPKTTKSHLPKESMMKVLGVIMCSMVNLLSQGFVFIF
jgi:hypothetical protein